MKCKWFVPTRISVKNISYKINLMSNKWDSVKNYQIYSTSHHDGSTHVGIATIIKISIKQHELGTDKYDYLKATNIVVDDALECLAIPAI